MDIDPKDAAQALNAVQTSFTIVEKATGMVKALIAKLPNSATKEEATKEIVHAEEDFKVARVQIAKSLGFPLCNRHFPPGIKLDIRHDIFPRWKCETCGDISPKGSAPAMRKKESWVRKTSL